MDIGIVDGFWFQIGRVLADLGIFLAIVALVVAAIAISVFWDSWKAKRRPAPPLKATPRKTGL